MAPLPGAVGQVANVREVASLRSARRVTMLVYLALTATFSENIWIVP